MLQRFQTFGSVTRRLSSKSKIMPPNHPTEHDGKEVHADSDTFLYFAFGSNLLQERIHVMNPTAVYVTNGKLRDYGLGFDGFSKRWMGSGATIYPSNGDHVHGCVWKLSNKDEKSLDKQEGCYKRLTVPITCNATSKTLYCRTYIMESVNKEALPSPHYMQVIVAGAKEHNLPDSYVEKLKSIEHNGHVGEIDMKLDLLKGFQQ